MLELTPYQIAAQAKVAYTHLRVRAVDNVLPFYQDLLGMQVLRKDGDTVYMTEGGIDQPILALTAAPHAAARSRRAPGLFHTAFRYASRAALAKALVRLLEGSYPLQGVSDHGVSEALYLADLEGNGVELYADRPKGAWRYSNGELAMVTETLDIPSLLEAARNENPQPEGMDVGHIHLQVADLRVSEAFYAGLLGFAVMQRSYPGALFVAAGGYHHHIGLNTWNSHGAAPAVEGSLGLQEFGIVMPDVKSWHEINYRLDEGKIPYRVEADAIWGEKLNLRDPDQIGVEIVHR